MSRLDLDRVSNGKISIKVEPCLLFQVKEDCAPSEGLASLSLMIYKI